MVIKVLWPGPTSGLYIKTLKIQIQIKKEGIKNTSKHSNHSTNNNYP
jgi:hypothetical protein